MLPLQTLLMTKEGTSTLDATLHYRSDFPYESEQELGKPWEKWEYWQKAKKGGPTPVLPELTIWGCTGLICTARFSNPEICQCRVPEEGKEVFLCCHLPKVQVGLYLDKVGMFWIP
jgi:hypothetical protein